MVNRAKSRGVHMLFTRVPVAVILALGVPASAQPAGEAEDIVTLQQKQLRNALGLGCRDGAASDEIVVCGNRGPSPYRLPLASVPEPGSRHLGEAVHQLDVMALNPERCLPARPRPATERLDLVAIAAATVAVAAKVADPDLEPAEPQLPKNCG